MKASMTVLGILVFFVGLLFSIAWHELGHLSTAKLFRIRVPQYMVGFGPTVWSRKRGETEYGVKAIPFGGYIRMIGMFPPGEDGRITKRSSSPWRGMIEDARRASYEELQPGDEHRLFYTRKPWQRVIVMFAGPFMNLILSVGLFLSLFMGIGQPTPVPSVDSITRCVVPAGSPIDTCPAGAPASPAAAAGLAPGDAIRSFDGQRITSYKQLQADIRGSAGKTVPIVVDRHGTERTLTATIATNKLDKLDRNGYGIPGQTVTVGYLGFEPAQPVTQLGLGQSFDQLGSMADTAVSSLAAVPGKIPALWDSVVAGKPRPADSPVGIVGAARIGGEVTAMKLPATQRLAVFVQLLAGINLSLFLFNMLPLLPLDGGHIAGALWESLRRKLAGLFHRPDPGPFDVARLMPYAYVVAAVFIAFTALVMTADIVNPVKLN